MKSVRLTFLIGAVFLACAVVPAAPAQSGTSGESEGSLAPGMTINARLKSTIDSKKAQPGEAITAETTEPLKSSDGRIILPKGSKLIGHVTQSTARSKGENQSLLAFQFDKGEVKNGQEVPLNNALVEAIAIPADEIFNTAAWPENGSAGQMPSSNPSMSGSSSTRPGAGTTGANPPNAYPGTMDQTQTGGGQLAGPLPPNSRGVYGLHGISLGRMNSPKGANSVVESNQKSVRLDSGTRLLLVEQPDEANVAPASK